MSAHLTPLILALTLILSACCESAPEPTQSPDAALAVDVAPAAPTAEKSLDDKCLLGDASACAQRARELRDGKGVAADPSRAHQLFELACRGDVKEACVDLGLSHLDEKNGHHDPRKARIAFKKACDVKHARGCFELGHLHSKGEGGPPDQAHALRHYYRACKAGHKEACQLAK